MKKFILYLSAIIILLFTFYLFFDLVPDINSSSKLSGIDISHYNEIEDWSKLKKSIDFVYIKSTEGKSFTDPNFKKNWGNAKKQNIIHGAYHFFSPNVSAKEQFLNFKKTVKLTSGDLPPVLDVERKKDESLNHFIMNIDMNEVNEWLRLVEEFYGVEPILYSDYITFKKLLDDEIKTKKIWIFLPKGYFLKPSFNDYDCAFWQYSHEGKINGIKDTVDLDLYFGDLTSLKNLLVK
jgi:lysozyme